jgi:hypothetical protein
MPTKTKAELQAEKEALKESARIRKLELEFEREMKKGTNPNPFDLKAKGGRINLKHGGGAALRGISPILKK